MTPSRADLIRNGSLSSLSARARSPTGLSHRSPPSRRRADDDVPKLSLLKDGAHDRAAAAVQMGLLVGYEPQSCSWRNLMGTEKLLRPPSSHACR